MLNLPIAPHIYLDERELHFSFARSSGPGGQNVNKVETAVKLHFDIIGSHSLPPDVKTRLLALAGRRVSREGVLVIDAQRFRSQHQNRVDAINRLVELIRRAAHVPAIRKPTKPSAGARQKRLTEKRLRSDVKRARTAKVPAE
jgi:ribosome-associated protein